MSKNTYRVVSAHKLSIKTSDGETVALRPGKSVELTPDVASTLGARVQLLHVGTAQAATAHAGKPASAPRPMPANDAASQDSTHAVRRDEGVHPETLRANDASTQDTTGDPAVTDGGDPTRHALHDLNATDAVALVMRAETIDSVNALEEVEKANPKHEGGRKGVLKAIESRRAALEG